MVLHLLLAAVLLPPLQAPLLPPEQRLRPVPARDVHLAADSFWGPRVATNLLVSLSHGAEMLEQHGQFPNFRLAAARLGHALPAGSAAPEKYTGVHYYDSDAYKWLEACCLALQQDAPEGTDAAAVAAARADLRARVDRFVDEIAAAQRDDGYIQTQYVVEGWEPFSKLESDHELYCAGHLIQAAIAHHDLTSERRLLDVALRFADLIDRTFGPDAAAGERPGCCGHPEIETALVQLSQHTGEPRWLDLASFFLECRGQKLAGGDDIRQDDKPVREQREARGHAVRQLYLCSGVLGVAAETGDAGLLDANLAIWDDIVRGKLYVTGGLGARADGEAFGAPFELPNERAYSETCASIAWMRWNQELLQATGDAKYADALETTLYNAFLASTSLDGKSFFYVNPLESRGGVHRQPWHWCACCPPNVMRTFAGLPGWVASTSGDMLWVHLYDDCVIDATLGDGRKVKVAVTTLWPEDQVVQLRILEGSGPMELALRVPACVARADMKLIAEDGRINAASRGFDDAAAGARVVRLRDSYVPGDIVQLLLPTTPELVRADPRVVADLDRVALRQGPVVYAFESLDQKDGLDELLLEPGAACERTTAGTTPAYSVTATRRTWPADAPLYAPRETTMRATSAVAIPYSAWSQRGDSSLRVWMPTLVKPPTFADDVEFLRAHNGVLVLRAEGCGPVAVSPWLTGRVMTSAFADSLPGFGLVNRAAILAGRVRRGFANYGGEDRLWLSPEGGPFGLFFEPGVEQTPENWSVPHDMDGHGRWTERDEDPATSVTFQLATVRLHGAADEQVTVEVGRRVEALSRAEIADLLGVQLDEDVLCVAFRSTNTLRWHDDPPARQRVGLWTLGQFVPTDDTVVLFPFRGDAARIKRDYFGFVPDDRLQLLLPAGPQAAGLARFTADSRLRSKIGLSRAGATGWIGAWDPQRGVLTLVHHTLPPEGAEVPDCDWRVPNPHASQGDVATSYNHGGEPGFFELESLSAALPRDPDASVEHVSTTIHLGGDRDVVREIARTVLHAEL
jgi:uncharacterized protein